MDVQVQRAPVLRGFQFKISLSEKINGISKKRKPMEAKKARQEMAKDIDVQVSQNVKLNVLISTSARSSCHPTLLPIHFWGGSSRTWAAFNESLSKDFNIVTPSLRGWGTSSKPPDSAAYKTSDYAGDIVALVRHLKQYRPELTLNGVILIGHSLGGKIAQKLLTYPEMEKQVRGVVLVGSSPAGGSDFSAEMKEKMAHVFDDVVSAENAFKQFLLGRRATGNAPMVRALADEAVIGGKEAVAAFPRYGCAEDFEASLAASLRRRKRETGILKFAVVEGGERPENAEEKVVNVLRAAGAEVSFRGLESGHLMPVEVPEQLAALVREFVDEL